MLPPDRPNHPNASPQYHQPVYGRALAGGVSTVSHSAGPILTLYLLQEHIDKRRLIGTMLIYTLLINLAKLVSYVTITHTVTLGTFQRVCG